MEHSQSSFKIGIPSNTALPQERTISNKPSNLTPKGTCKRTKPKVNGGKKIQIRAKINKSQKKIQKTGPGVAPCIEHRL